MLIQNALVQTTFFYVTIMYVSVIKSILLNPKYVFSKIFSLCQEFDFICFLKLYYIINRHFDCIYSAAKISPIKAISLALNNLLYTYIKYIWRAKWTVLDDPTQCLCNVQNFRYFRAMWVIIYKFTFVRISRNNYKWNLYN